MPTKTVDTPSRAADLHPSKPTSGPAHDARQACARASEQSVKIRDEYSALKAERHMLTAELVEAFTAGKSAAKLLTRAGDIEARVNAIAFQQQAISAACFHRLKRCIEIGDLVYRVGG